MKTLASLISPGNHLLSQITQEAASLFTPQIPDTVIIVFNNHFFPSFTKSTPYPKHPISHYQLANWQLAGAKPTFFLFLSGL